MYLRRTALTYGKHFLLYWERERALSVGWCFILRTRSWSWHLYPSGRSLTLARYRRLP